MLDIKQIRENPELIEAGLLKRGKVDYGIGKLIALDKERRDLLQMADDLKKLRNDASREIGARKKAGENTDEAQAKVKETGEKIKSHDDRIKEIDDEVRQILLNIPNIPDGSVPEGADENANVEIRKFGEIPEFDFVPKAHHELGEALGILDFKRAAKLSGARFVLYKGAGALLERALINFMLDMHINEHGYTEVAPPYMVSAETMTGTGQLPKFADDLFKIEGRDLWLIPTAETPVTNIYAGEILSGADLPLKMVAYTPCFRSEAGSYGRDTTGLIRQHQFNKVELVKITKPEDSANELEKLTTNAEEVLKRLGLPYRVITLCSGDIGFSAAKTYDIEVWVPSQKTYREISSCSTFVDYQSRRMGMRFRREAKGKPEFPHTINGSGLAVGRTVVAILENMQEADGSVRIPSALSPYMGGLKKIVM
ncbi:Seryl-tRNA synthetase [hydrothermal vent metagenome]|uniref:Serine--tRNA ligase n=1 Tax=hydrothermal vent metagenome TaxID=652676 RepID=A0A3B1C202_9ZZZZ